MSSKPFAITLDVGTSLANRTGSWRTLRPVYVNRLPPCNAKCPAGEQCQAWLYHAESGDYRHAWEKIVEDNPFPACMGRVCYHTCESACNRGELDESVGINAVERFLGDHALENGWSFKKPETKSGKRVLVVGAGPAGLSAAYHLARMGHEVCVRDGAKAAGGMMRYGIPKYRLPREVLDKEIARIAELGVKFELSREVTDLAAEMKEGGFDAVFLGVGASLARRAYIPAGDAAHVLDAVTVLRSMEGEEQPLLGRQILPRLGVGSVKGPDVGQRQNVRRMIPALQGQKHIRPHEKPQLILRMLHAQLAQGIHRIAGAGAVQLDIQGLGHGAQLGTGQGRHFQAVGGVGAALGQGLVGRNAGGDQQQTVQPQSVHSRPGRRQMAPVDGVEGAAVDADLHTLRFLSFSSSIFRLSLLC